MGVTCAAYSSGLIPARQFLSAANSSANAASACLTAENLQQLGSPLCSRCRAVRLTGWWSSETRQQESQAVVRPDFVVWESQAVQRE